MADFKIFFHRLVQEEGGYVNNPNDHGGPTKYGVTLKVWLAQGYDKNQDGVINAEDIKLLSLDDAYKIAKEDYWDVIRGDDINNQSIANLIFDFSYLSGSVTAIEHVQGCLDIREDGVIGPVTINAINTADQASLFTNIKNDREQFFYSIVARKPSQKEFLKGWLIRNNSFKFVA